MQPGNYSPHQYQRFGPREPRPRFAGSPYQNFSPNFYSPNSQAMFRSRAPLRNGSPCNPNNYSQVENSPSADGDALEGDFIPLNSSGTGGSFGAQDSPANSSDHCFQRRPSRGYSNHRRSHNPHWNYNSPVGSGGRRYNSPKHNFGNRNNQEYSPRSGFGQRDNIQGYISDEFLKDPWEQLEAPKKLPDVTQYS